MIERTTSLAANAAPSFQTAAPGAAGEGFTQTLEAFLDASTPVADPAPGATGARQDDAGNGKDVPQEAPDAQDDRASTLAPVWLPGLPLSPAMFGTAPAAAPAALGGSAVITNPAPALAPVTAPVSGLTPNTIFPPSTPTVTPDDQVATTLVTQPDASSIRGHASAAVPIVTVLPGHATQQTGALPPPHQAFAASFGALLATPKRFRVDTGDDTGTPLLAAEPTHIALSTAVGAAGDAQQSGLDLRQDRGIAQMIDHIEALRDDANAADTRIRLVPDALGTVDVAVRKDGDAVHVHFSAQSDATRAVIAEAQPRLTELAEARGVRIAGASIDSGTSGGTNGGRGQPQPRHDFTRPAPAQRPASMTDIDDINGQRLA